MIWPIAVTSTQTVVFRLSCLFLFGGVLALLIFASSFQLVTFREGFLPWIKVLIRRTSCDIIDWTGNIVSPLIVVFWMRLVVQPISWCFFVEMILYLHSIRYSCNAWSPTTNERKTERNGINDNKWILEWMNMKWTNLLKGSSPSPYFLDIFYIFRIDQDLLGLTFPANMCSTYATQLALLALSLWRVWTWSFQVPGSCVCLRRRYRTYVTYVFAVGGNHKLSM